MKIAWFTHAVASCWNNGNAHFLRGLGVALGQMGHEVVFYEPQRSWSEANLIRDHGQNALAGFRSFFPRLHIEKYDPDSADIGALVNGADLVVVHEWNEPSLVNTIGLLRKHDAQFVLLFQDTHHRSLSNPAEMRQFDLSHFDGVLAFGEAIANIYRCRGWADRVWVLHEAADTSVFYPRRAEQEYDVVWIGNWGDEERTSELHTFLITPVEELNLRARVYGVRYPESARSELAARRISYCGWLPNHEVPLAFARSRFTIHVPRQQYARALPGIPTIRVFEALACGIPLISAPWEDCEQLFPHGCYLSAANSAQMCKHMRDIVNDPSLRYELRQNGLSTIAARHTCRHRAAQLLDIYSGLKSIHTREAA